MAEDSSERGVPDIAEIDVNRIKELIPHRYPFLMIDKIRSIEFDKRAIGIKNVSVNEPHFDGHFPNRPVMPGVLIIETMAQTAGCLVVTTLGEEAEGKLTSVGKPVRGNNYILVDNDDQIQPLGGTGEICTRSVHWMIEYHNRPDATEEIVLRDKNGLLWMRTGDIGRTDKDGFLYIVDRKKDMILSGGQNIYPADIEAVMVNHADVSEVAVIGVSDETWGETPVAVIVPNRPMTDADIDSLLTWTNERVGKRQRIRSVYLNTDMPRNPNGKILKRELRAKFESTPS